MSSDIVSAILWNVLLFGLFVIYFYALRSTVSSQKGTGSRYLSIFLYFSVFGLFLLIFLGGLLSHVLGMVIKSIPVDVLKDLFQMSSISNEFYADFHIIGFAIWLPALLAMLIFVPFFRKQLARVVPIDPHNRVHSVTFAWSMLIILQLTIMTAIGLDTLNQLETSTYSTGLTLANIWSQDLMLFLLAMIGVGWLTTRNIGETLARLGIAKTSWQQFLLALGVAVLFVLLGHLVEMLTAYFNWGTDKDVEEYTEKLIGPLFTSFFGILTLGLAAAIGEESIFRGALQPRFGIVLTSVLFALMHGNYGLSLSTVIVLLLGLSMGWLRYRYNTTFTMIVHAAYNILLGLMVYYQFPS